MTNVLGCKWSLLLIKEISLKNWAISLERIQGTVISSN